MDASELVPVSEGDDQNAEGSKKLYLVRKWEDALAPKEVQESLTEIEDGIFDMIINCKDKLFRKQVDVESIPGCENIDNDDDDDVKNNSIDDECSQNFVNSGGSEACDSDDDELLEAPIAVKPGSQPIEAVSSPKPANLHSAAYSLDHLLANMKLFGKGHKDSDGSAADAEPDNFEDETSDLPKNSNTGGPMLSVPSEGHITDTAPGRDIFHSEDYKCAFSYPVSSNLMSCGWHHNELSNAVFQFLNSVSDLDGNHLTELICMGIFEQHCDSLLMSRHLKPVMKFLFLLMSEIDDFMTLNACYESLKEIISQANLRNDNFDLFQVNLEICLVVLKNMGKLYNV